MPAVQLVGVPEEVLNDSRVQQAIADVERKPEVTASQTLTRALQNGVEKYGVKLRTISLTVTGPILAQMMGFKLPEAHQLPAMLFVLGAPLKQVYRALAEGDKEGWPSFMAIASEWVAQSGIPMDMSQETMDAVMHTFTVANKLIGGGNDDGKKA
jgi:hypothetical protein